MERERAKQYQVKEHVRNREQVKRVEKSHNPIPDQNEYSSIKTKEKKNKIKNWNEEKNIHTNTLPYYMYP